MIERFEVGNKLESNINSFISKYSEDEDNYESEYLGGYGTGLRLFYKDIFSFKYDLGFPIDKEEGNKDSYHYFLLNFYFF